LEIDISCSSLKKELKSDKKYQLQIAVLLRHVHRR